MIISCRGNVFTEALPRNESGISSHLAIHATICNCNSECEKRSFAQLQESWIGNHGHRQLKWHYNYCFYLQANHTDVAQNRGHNLCLSWHIMGCSSPGTNHTVLLMGSEPRNISTGYKLRLVTDTPGLASAFPNGYRGNDTDGCRLFPPTLINCMDRVWWCYEVPNPCLWTRLPTVTSARDVQMKVRGPYVSHTTLLRVWLPGRALLSAKPSPLFKIAT
jgi:hypothetical protein